MAVNSIDKAMRPLDVEELEGDETFEVDVEDDDEEESPEVEAAEDAPSFGDNLAEAISDEDLRKAETELWAMVQNDKMSRKEWDQTLKEGLKLLGMKYEERSEPWEGACGMYHPVLAEAVVRFQSETVMETFPASGPVKTVILGDQSPEKIAAAQRVRDDMNYQLTEVMPEYRAEHERMLFSLPLQGCAFKKVYYDPNIQRQVSCFVPAEDVILPYGSTELFTAERITHELRKTEYEVKRLKEVGFYSEKADENSPTPVTPGEITEAKDEQIGVKEQDPSLYKFYEMGVRWQFESLGDERAKPYIITLDDMGAIVAVRRNWLEEDELALPRQHFVKYDYVPGFGPYGFGLVHLIGGAAMGATTILRILVDGGELASLQGGFKATGMRARNTNQTVGPNEWVDVDVPSGSLKDNIVPLPFKEPSAVLAGLLDKIVEDARRVAATADMDISDMSAQAPVGTTMALLERMLKVMSAVQARVHFSFKQELKLLAGIVRDYLPDEYDYDVTNAPRSTRGQDYDMVEIIPVSDPNAATLSQRIVLYQAVMMLAEKAPNLYDQHELHRQMLEALGVKNIQKLLPSAKDMPLLDPVTENMNVINGRPVKAFLTQDHNAHLAVHNNMLVDPMIQMQIGQSPNAQMITGALMAHINEHLAFQYRAQMEQNLGVPLPPPDQPLPPQIEAQMAPMLAEASKMLLAQNKIAAAQQQAQQAANDPTLALQHEELQLKREKLAAEERDSVRDYTVAKEKLAIQRESLGVDVAKHTTKLAADRLNAVEQRRSSESGKRVDTMLKVADMRESSRQADKNHAAKQQAAQNKAAPTPKK